MLGVCKHVSGTTCKCNARINPFLGRTTERSATIVLCPSGVLNLLLSVGSIPDWALMGSSNAACQHSVATKA